MQKISTGEESTLKTYRMIAEVLGGKDSKAVKFFDEKIKESSNGENEEVIADERQMLILIASMIREEMQDDTGRSKE
jgi:hypothetical protein